jgi:hypothetical protein
MSVVLGKLEIEIDFQKYEGFCLGKVINDNLSAIQKIGANALSVQVCNEHWYGSFPIPSAVGFSTPIGILKDASIICYRTNQATDKIFDELKKWNEIFRGKLVRQDDVYTFTSDKKTCSICTEDYKSGDKLIVARKCDHVFHSTCLQKWRLQNKSIHDVVISRIMEETIQYDCPLCRGHTS